MQDEVKENQTFTSKITDHSSILYASEIHKITSIEQMSVCTDDSVFLTCQHN